MIEETGKVVAIEKGAVWIETIRKSSCDSCASKQGCGHSVLAKISSAANHVRVLNDFDLDVGDDVVIGVPEDVVVIGSVIAYLMPLACLLVFTIMGKLVFGSEGYGIVRGFGGLIVGFSMVRWHFLKRKDDVRFQPSVIRSKSASAFGVCKIYPA